MNIDIFDNVDDFFVPINLEECIKSFTAIINENIGNKIFIEYKEDKDLYIQPFNINKNVIKGAVEVIRLSDNSTLNVSISSITGIAQIHDEELLNKEIDRCLTNYKILDEPAYQGLIEKGTSKYKIFMKKRFLSYNVAGIPIENIFLMVILDCNNYEELIEASPEDLKPKWLKLISSYQQKAIDMLTLEKEECKLSGDIDDVEEIDVILQLLDDLTEEIEEELSPLNCIKDILSYWPPLLLPAPNFIPCNVN